MAFICAECLTRFNNFGISFSYGPCEFCGRGSNCYDIPSKFLIERKDMSIVKVEKDWPIINICINDILESSDQYKELYTSNPFFHTIVNSISEGINVIQMIDIIANLCVVNDKQKQEILHAISTLSKIPSFNNHG